MPKDTESNHTESYTTEAQPQLERNSGSPQKRGNVLYMPATSRQESTPEDLDQNEIDASQVARTNSPATVTPIQSRQKQKATKPFKWKDRVYLFLTRFAKWAGWLQLEDIDPKDVDRYIELKTASAARTQP